MYLTVKIPLYPDEKQTVVLEDYHQVFCGEIERIYRVYQQKGEIVFYPYNKMDNRISFYSKSQVLSYAEHLYMKRVKNIAFRYLGYFSLMPQSFQLDDAGLHITLGRLFYCHNLYVELKLTVQQRERIKGGEMVKMDIVKEREDYFARLIISCHTDEVNAVDAAKKMGVDIGVKCPAVCYTSDGKVKFIGNGREIRYHTRQIQEKLKGIRIQDKTKMQKFNHNLKNYKIYIDHKVSKDIVAFAIEQGVGVIMLERLVNLQKKFHYHDLMCWSYQRLQTFICYKAELAGIKVVFVDPKLTSKKCPHCGKINNVKDRSYICRCGFKSHRDLVGAMNILHAPEVQE